MDEQIKPLYREIENRYVKISWTHKIQEKQADIYLAKSNCNKWIMAISNGLSTTSAFVTVVTSALKTIDAVWLMPAITSLLALISTILTLRYKDGVLEESASACKQYAAKCRNLRNKYEGILTDIKTGRLVDIESVSAKRDWMTEVENELFAGDIAPQTTGKAITYAREALMVNEDSLTSESEIKAIVPLHLQEL